MHHHLKIELKWYARILSGEKKFEVRDTVKYDFQVGDTIQYHPLPSTDDFFDPPKPFLPNYRPHYRIIYIHSVMGMIPGWVVLGIEEIKEGT